MRFVNLGFLLFLLLASCAQVGTITGGEKDVISPQISRRSISANAINFKDKEITLDFNEYVQLAVQQDNIAIIPPDAIILSKLNKKRLTLSWTEDLKANTTYRIYLNNAVKDVTEGNSSLIDLIFSTGPIIDSLFLSVLAYDGFYGVPLPNVLVGIYDSLTQLKPRCFSQSNANGYVYLKNIAEGTYFLKAFLDVNKDLLIQATEVQGGLFSQIKIDGQQTDTIKVALSKPLMKDKIKNIKFIPPGLIGLHLPNESSRDSVFLDGQRIREFMPVGIDSALIATGPITSDVSWFIIGKDSTRVRTLEKDRTLKLVPKYMPQNSVSAFPFHAVFEVKDKIAGLDKGKFSCLNLADSVKIIPDSIVFFDNKLELFLKWNNLTSVAFHGDEGAIKGSSGSISAAFNTKIVVAQSRDFGRIVLNCSNQSKNAIIQLMKGDVLVREVPINTTMKYVFTDLIPGEYYLRILLDENANGRWDPFSWENKCQAESVLWYRSIIKVRANWEVESTLLD